jgi:GxxExxY protein
MFLTAVSSSAVALVVVFSVVCVVSFMCCVCCVCCVCCCAVVGQRRKIIFLTEGNEGNEEKLQFQGLLIVKDFMHSLFKKADDLSRLVIGAAIEVHRLKGPGLIESIYERCVMRELEWRKIKSVNQRLVRVEYKGLVFEEPLRCDVLVEDCLLLELKCVKTILEIHKAQLLSYMKLLDVPVGLIINFHELKLRDGIVRMIIPGANR